MPSRALRAICVAAFAALLAALAIRNAHGLNPDGVSYVRLAEYYSRGEIALALSGYWSPLLSWLIALAMGAGMAPLAAARLTMALSAFVYLAGCVSVLQRGGVPDRVARVGSLIAALAAASWSVELITPDLLAGGLLCFAIARVIHLPTATRTDAVLGGLSFGLAYLAKAAALPFAVLAMLAYAILAMRDFPASASAIVRKTALTLVVTLLIAAPWIAVLSVHYRSLLFSTSGGINHAVSGPPPIDRSHPAFRTISKPESGRITNWEEPSLMNYAMWSPFSSMANLRFQLLLIGRNLWTFVRILGEFGSAVAICILAAFSVAGTRRRVSSTGAIPVICYLVPVVVLAALYSPLHIDTENLRFFYALLPFLFIVGMHGVIVLTEFGPINRTLRISAITAGLLLFASPPAVRLVRALDGATTAASESVFQTAEALRRRGVRGAVVGGANLQGAPGLAVAFLINEPWYGDMPRPSALAYARSGARLAVVPRWSAVERELRTSPGVRDLDPILFPRRTDRPVSPVRVFDLQPRPYP